MKLLTPERSTEGFRIRLAEPAQTPEIHYDGMAWIANTEWMRASDTLRTHLLTILYDAKDTLFKTSPTRKTLESLFAPVVIIDPSGALQIQCSLPVPSSPKEGTGILELTGITIQKAGIIPTWNLKTYVENTPVVDFDWSEPPADEIREINLIDETAPAESTDTLRLHTDEEYNARKFATKERVKEARLKAILARRAAEVETQRYFDEFNINDNESSFSEYDISDFSEGSEAEEGD